MTNQINMGKRYGNNATWKTKKTGALIVTPTITTFKASILGLEHVSFATRTLKDSADYLIVNTKIF